jgi:hypothetical protein
MISAGTSSTNQVRCSLQLPLPAVVDRSQDGALTLPGQFTTWALMRKRGCVCVVHAQELWSLLPYICLD